MDTTAEHLLKSLNELSSTFNDRMLEFEKNLQQPGAKDSNTTVKTLAADFSSFKSFVWKTLAILRSQIELLAQGIDRLDTLSRRKVLLLHGIQEDIDEDLVKKLLEVLSNQMKLTGVSSEAFESCHRLGAKKKDSPRPVLVRFSSLKQRMMVWNNKTSLKGSKVTVSEFLTKARQELFVAARSHFGKRKCWTSDGTINILLADSSRKKIYSNTELQCLITQHPNQPTDVPRRKVK